MSSRRPTRRAPHRFALSGHPIARGLQSAVIPALGVGYIDLVSGFQGAASTNLLNATASGLGRRHASTQFAFGANTQPTLRMPSTWPMSVFIHATRHTTDTTAQCILGNGGYHPTGGWLFYVNGTGAQTEMLFSEVSVLATYATALGAPVVGGAGNSMGFAVDTGSTTMRFFLNGAFCDGTVNSSIGPAGFPNYIISGDGLNQNLLLDWTVHAVYVWNRAVTDAEMQQLYDDPWLLIRPRATRARMAAASPQTVTPGVGALTLAGFAPNASASNNQAVTPGVGALTLTGFAPTAGSAQFVVPGVGSLILAGFVPTVATTGISVRPGTGALVLTGSAPLIYSLPQVVTGVYIIENFEDCDLDGTPGYFGGASSFVASSLHPEFGSNCHLRMVRGISSTTWYVCSTVSLGGDNTIYVSFSVDKLPVPGTRMCIFSIETDLTISEAAAGRYYAPYASVWLHADGRLVWQEADPGAPAQFPTISAVAFGPEEAVTPGTYMQIAYSMPSQLRVFQLQSVRWLRINSGPQHDLGQPPIRVDDSGIFVVLGGIRGATTEQTSTWDFDNILFESYAPNNVATPQWLYYASSGGFADVTQLPVQIVSDAASVVSATQLPLQLVSDSASVVSATQLPLQLVSDAGSVVSATQLPLILVRQRELGRIKLGYTLGLEVLTQ